jgi:hypothetical protein
LPGPTHHRLPDEVVYEVPSEQCPGHKGRNIIERLDPSLHAGVKKVLRQAWDSPTAEQAERVLKNLARRLDHDAPGVSASIHEGLDEMLTVIRLGLPAELRRSLGCTNAIESLIAVLRQVCRNVKRWREGILIRNRKSIGSGPDAALELAMRPGSVSAMVGTSGSMSNRLLPATPSARRAPLRTCGSDVTITSNPTGTCPAIKSVTMGALPR